MRFPNPPHRVEPLEPRRLLAAAAGHPDPTSRPDGVRVYDDIPAPAVGVATQSDGKSPRRDRVHRLPLQTRRLDRQILRPPRPRHPRLRPQGPGRDHNGRIAVGGGTPDHQWAAARYPPTAPPRQHLQRHRPARHPRQQRTARSGPTSWPSSPTARSSSAAPGSTATTTPWTTSTSTPSSSASTPTAPSTPPSAPTAKPGYPFFNVVDAVAVAPNGNIVLAGQENLGMSIHDEHYEVVDSAGRPVTGHPPPTRLLHEFRAAAFRPDGTRVLADEAMGNSVVSFDDRGARLAFDPPTPSA